MSLLKTPKDAALRLTPKGFEFEALYDWGGFWNIRMKPLNGGKKEFRPMHTTDQGNYVLGLPNFPNGKPLYRLHKIISCQDETIFICEGEKAVDALEKIGVLATTSGSADSANSANWQSLAGRKVVIWPDNDKSGQDYATKVTLILQKIGCEILRLKIDDLNLPPKGDAVEWLQANTSATKDNLLDMLEPHIENLSIGFNNKSTFDSEENLCGMPENLDDSESTFSRPTALPELPDVLSFDYLHMPEEVRGYIKDISERMQCPPDYVAIAVYVMLSTVIGRKVGIRPKKLDDWTVTPNLWAAAIGHSGVKKSPALKEALTPIKKLEANAYIEFEHENHEYITQSELAKLQKTLGTSDAKKALKAQKINEAKDFLKQHEGNDKPILKRYITNDVSYEALGELMIENPNGVMIFSDELVGLLKRLDSSGQEPARAFYLTAADGNQSYTFDRIMRGKGLRIPAVCASILGGIQPGVLAEYVRQATNDGAGADGLLQRFGLMVYPDISPEYKHIDRAPDGLARSKLEALVGKLSDYDALKVGAHFDGCGGMPFIRLDESAQILFSTWDVALQRRIRSGEEHPAIVSHLSKYPKLILSLALLNHFCDSTNNVVSENSLKRAIAYGEYLESHARRVYSFAVRPEIEAAKTLLKRLEKEKLLIPFTGRDVSQKDWVGLNSPAKAQAAIDLLCEYGHLIAEDVINKVGRSTVCYHWVKVESNK